MEALIFLVPFAFAIGIVVLIRVLAGMDNGVGRVFRWFWNTSFKFAAVIPFMGWMTCFMIGEEREIWMPIGKHADEFGYYLVEQEANKRKADRLRKEATERHLLSLGYSDVRVSNDGRSAKGYSRDGVYENITMVEQ